MNPYDYLNVIVSASVMTKQVASYTLISMVLLLITCQNKKITNNGQYIAMWLSFTFSYMSMITNGLLIVKLDSYSLQPNMIVPSWLVPWWIISEIIFCFNIIIFIFYFLVMNIHIHSEDRIALINEAYRSDKLLAKTVSISCTCINLLITCIFMTLLMILCTPGYC